MDWLTHLLWFNDKFLGIEWHFWKIVGWIGNLTFSSRFFLQWWATERHQRVVVPTLFWWLSLVGSGCLLAYSIERRDSVYIFAYAFVWIPYIRNLMIGHQHKKSRLNCPNCAALCPPKANYCPACGRKLTDAAPDA